MDADTQFAALVEHFTDRPDVQPPGPGGRFGSAALTVDGAIFAMLRHGHLVVKLPADRVADLITTDRGGPFDAGKGRPMREWLTASNPQDWLALAEEALTFARTRSRPR
jgi:hypothetical protein